MKPSDLIPRRRRRPAWLLLGAGAASALLAGTVFVWQKGAAPGASQSKSPEIAMRFLRRPESGLDNFGDPLPPGAVRRLGSARLRHGSPVKGVHFLDGGKILVSGSDDGTISFWDVATAREIRRTKVPGGVEALAVSRTGDAIAASGSGSSALLLNPETGSPISRIQLGMKGRFDGSETRQLTFSPDGRSIALLRRDGSVVSWDIPSGAAHAPPAQPLGVFVAFGSNTDLVLGARDGTVELRRLSNGDVLHRWSSERGNEIYAVTRDRGILAATPAGQLTLFELPTGRELEKLDSRSGCSALVFSRDDRLLAAGTRGGSVLVFRVESGERLLEIQEGQSKVEAIDLSPDGTTLAWGGMDGRIRLWNLETGKPLHDFAGHSGSVRSIAFDDRNLVAGSADGTIAEWNLESGEAQSRQFPDEIHLVSYLADKRLLAVGSRGYHVWDRRTGFGMTEVSFGDHRRDFAVSGDMLVAGARGLAEIWDITSGDKKSWVVEENERPLAISPSGKTVAMSRGGKWLVLRGTDGQVGSQAQLSYGWSTSSMCFLPGGEHLVTDVDVFKLSPEALSGSSDIKPFSTYRRSGLCAVSPDGRLLATRGTGDRSIELHDIRLSPEPTISRRFPIGEHRGKVTSLAFSTDGRTLASGGAEGTILLWNMTELVPLGTGAERPPEEALNESGSRLRVGVSFDGGSVSGAGIVTTYVTNLSEQEGELRFVPGVENEAAQWRGALEFPETTSLELDGAYTIQFWFRLEPQEDGKPAAHRSVFRSDLVTFDVRDGKPCFFFHYENGGHMQSTPFEDGEIMTPGRWYHCAVSHEPDIGKFFVYIDGVLRDTRGDEGPRLAHRLGPIRLGGWSRGPSFAGAVDELAIYDEARSYSQIAEAAGLDGPVVETPRLKPEDLTPAEPHGLPAEDPLLDENITHLVRVQEWEAFVTYVFVGELLETKILDIAADDDLVWMATDRGVIRHDPADGSFALYGNNTGIPGAYVSNIALMGGRLAVQLGSFGFPNSVMGLGTFLFDPNEKTWKLFQLGGGELMWDGERLWREIDAIDPVSKEIERFPVGEGGLLDGSVSAVERHGDVVFFALRGHYIQEKEDFEGGGVSRLKLSTGEWRSYRRADGLARDYSAALSVEAEEVWVVHWEEEMGISRLDRLRDRWTSLRQSANHIELGGTNVESDDGTVFIGQQGGLVVLDENTLRAKAYRERDGLPGYIVSALALGRDFVWAGAYSYGNPRIRSSGLVRLPRR